MVICLSCFGASLYSVLIFYFSRQKLNRQSDVLLGLDDFYLGSLFATFWERAAHSVNRMFLLYYVYFIFLLFSMLVLCFSLHQFLNVAYLLLLLYNKRFEGFLIKWARVCWILL